MQNKPEKKKKRVKLHVGRLLLFLIVFAVVMAGAFFLLHACDQDPETQQVFEDSVPTPTPVVYVEGYLRADRDTMIPAYE